MADVQRVVATLLVETGFGFGKGGTEERVAVGGEDYLPGTEVEGDDGNACLGDGESVDDGVGLVLVLHLAEHLGDDRGAGLVVGKDLFGGLAFGQSEDAGDGV